jgi:hypothetical protein
MIKFVTLAAAMSLQRDRILSFFEFVSLTSKSSAGWCETTARSQAFF